MGLGSCIIFSVESTISIWDAISFLEMRVASDPEKT